MKIGGDEAPYGLLEAEEAQFARRSVGTKAVGEVEGSSGAGGDGGGVS
jgi:hypothetical protein